jgi:heme-degrading monooxygenase HmoA
MEASLMFARNVSFHLKSNSHSDYIRTFENEILPLLRKQKGFKEELTLSNPNSQETIAISLWENKANADAYTTNTYPEVLRTLGKMIDGTPKVQTFDTVVSTAHVLQAV